MMNHDELIQQLTSAVVEGDEGESARLAEEGVTTAGIDPMTLIKGAIQPAMDIVGNDFERGYSYLPELILAGDAAKAALGYIIPQISEEDQGTATFSELGTVVIGTMFGDNHDIGKNIVSAILVAYGFKIVDLGINVPPKDFFEAATKAGADIIAASTLITTSLPYQRQIIEILKETGQRDKHFVIVGGGPVTPEWTRKIGADGYGRDAKDAANLCQKLMSGGLKPPMDEPFIIGALKR
jgi:methylmalonyl-CoA mutase cobalamin-binding domain/chain